MSLAGNRRQTRVAGGCSASISRAVDHLDALAAGLTPHYFPALAAVGTNKKYLFHNVLLFLFNHSVTTLPRHDLTGFVIHLKLADHAKR